MEDKHNTNRGWLSEHIHDLWAFFRNWFCYVLSKGTGNKCEDHKASTVAIGLLCLYFISSGIYFNLTEFTKSILGISDDNTVQKDNLAAVSSASSIKIHIPLDASSEKIKGCDLHNGKWVRWYGKINHDFEDKSYFVLPTNSHGALFKYTGNIDDFSSCEFTFIPRSDNSMNYVISVDGVYQMVIGDNDYWTITLRASDQVEGDLIPIKENVIQKTRPRLTSPVKKGTTVKVLITQHFLDNQKYEVAAEVTYKPDIGNSSEENKEKFSWIFYPSPTILDSAELSVGLVRNPSDLSEIGASFVSPNIVSEIK